MMSRPPKPHDPGACCPELPELRRLQYFYGQLLGSQDFRDEQSYFREKLRLAHRCLHGYGVVCGLTVTPAPAEEPCEPEDDRKRRQLEERLAEVEEECRRLEEALASEEYGDEAGQEELAERLARCRGRKEEIERLLEELCPPGDEERRSPRVVVDCGVALDCAGDEIVLRRPRPVDLWEALERGDRRRVEELLEQGEEVSLYLSICYCELPVEPVRPVHSDACSPPDGCRHAKLQDSYRLSVGLEAPPLDRRCDPCCCACGDPCLLLARIDGFRPGRAVTAEQIHHHVRRELALHEWATVTGVSWVHGGRYDPDEAALVLGRDGQGAGLEVRFSRPVQAATLLPGVLTVTVVEGFAGGSGRSSDLYNVTGELEPPAGPTTDRLVWRQTSDDSFHEGDMVLIRLKADFILDECCRPLDGNHVGGRVPLLADHAGDHHPEVEAEACAEPPSRPGPWRSGNGQGGGVFESWLFID